MKTRMHPQSPVLMVIVLILAVGMISLAQKGNDAKIETAPGIRIITVDAPVGKVKLTLPADMAAGDTISGTVISTPSGKTDQEKQQNAGVLNGYVIEIANQKSPVSSGVIQRLHIGAGITTPRLVLLDAKGKPVATAIIPVAAEPATTGRTNFVVGPVGQTGRPIEVIGPFDGDSANTKVSVGGSDAPVLAESPRQVVVESPRTVVGASKIEVSENGATASGAFRNLKIDLTAPKTSLLKGESTELHVQVNGLEGITQPIPIQIQNQSPSTVNISGGNMQTIPIQPSQVQAGGTFSWSTSVTGTGSGGFSITGSLPPGVFFAPTPTAPPSTTKPSPTPSPLSQPSDTIVRRPGDPEPPSGDNTKIEMLQLQLQSNKPMASPSPSPVVTSVPEPEAPKVTEPPLRPPSLPSPSPDPTRPPYVPPSGPATDPVRPTIPGSGTRIIPKPTPVPVPVPCACDTVTLFVQDPPGPNKVKLTKGEDVTNAAGEITGKKMTATLTLVGHEIKCTGGDAKVCKATVDWSIANTDFTFTLKGKLWNAKKGTAATEGGMNYEEESKTKPPASIDLEGTCDLKAPPKKRSFTVSQVLTVTYPDDLVRALKDAKANKTKVEVGEISGSITWTVKVENCKSKFVLTAGNKKTEPGGALVTQFIITGGTHKF